MRMRGYEDLKKMQTKARKKKFHFLIRILYSIVNFIDNWKKIPYSLSWYLYPRNPLYHIEVWRELRSGYDIWSGFHQLREKGREEIFVIFKRGAGWFQGVGWRGHAPPPNYRQFWRLTTSTNLLIYLILRPHFSLIDFSILILPSKQKWG